MLEGGYGGEVCKLYLFGIGKGLKNIYICICIRVNNINFIYTMYNI